MLGIFKKSLSQAKMVSAIGEAVCKTQDSLVAQIKQNSPAQSDQTAYSKDAAAFAFVMGWYSIQSSNLGWADKHRFSAELLGYVSGRCLGGMDIESVNFFQSRLNGYRDALASGPGDDDYTRLTVALLALLEKSNDLGLRMGQCVRTKTTILATTKFINETCKNYKFV